jgi:nitrite reductase/ring-hydroxylating ferredoxin subunit
MINLILPSGYTDEKKFISEQKLIFQSQWQFIGFTIDLEQNNDFITRSIGGRPIVIQNFKGEIRAFDNICRHRHSIIQCNPKGNRSLTCPYHAWTYDRSGVASGIFHKDDFNSSLINDPGNITLRRYRVETSGKFVFVSLDDNVISPSAVAEALARQVAEYNRQVFIEDQIICEAVQQGLEKSDDSHPGLLNSCESRILGFQQAYNAIMSESEALEFNNSYSFSEQVPCLN